MLEVISEIRDWKSCSIELITPADWKDILLGAKIRVWGNSLFLDAPIWINPSPDINLFLHRLLSSTDVVISWDRKLKLDWKSYIQLWVASTRDWFRDTVEMILPNNIKGGSNVDVMRDEWNSEKQKWRLQMISFASKIFEKSSFRGRVILMPGSSDIEYRLWKSLWFDISNMIFIEGDKRKYDNLIHSLPNGVCIVNEYLWSSLHKFTPALLSQSAWKNTSILSLDTESNLTPNLYIDIVRFIDEADIAEDFILILNIVAQRDNINEIESLWKEKLWDMYNPWEYHPRSYVLGKIPEMILWDIQRDDLTLKHASTIWYIGFWDTRMECVFAHFRKKA